MSSKLDGVVTQVIQSMKRLPVDEVKPKGIHNEAFQQIPYDGRVIVNKAEGIGHLMEKAVEGPDGLSATKR